MRQKKDWFMGFTLVCGFLILGFILLPLIKMVVSTNITSLKHAISEKEVRASIWLSIYVSTSASIISFLIGTPFAYFMARKQFIGKRLVESIIDLPIVIPHTVVGIALLSVVGKNFLVGKILYQLGIRMIGSVPGIITVLTFVGMPFYINTVKERFEDIPPRLEKVSRSLGASSTATFLRITFPLAWRSVIAGMIMCWARAISEFGAVIIIAYHPMIAPVLIYERFEAFGLNYSRPVAVWLIIICLTMFILLRLLTIPKKGKR